MTVQAASQGGVTGNVVHFHAIRVRVNGTGDMHITGYCMDDARSQVLVPITMEQLPGKIMNRLMNMTEQMVQFEFKTTDIDDRFRINRIVIFTKEVASSWPE